MMNYDPYQTYPQLGPYSGITAPISFPYAAQQNPVNAATSLNPLAAAALGLSSNMQNPGIGQGGQSINPGFGTQGSIGLQQLQLAALLAAQGVIPQLQGLSPMAGGLLGPQWAGGYHNPLLNPLLNPLTFSVGSQYGYQPHSPYGQIGSSPFGQQQQQIGLPYQGNPYQTNQLFGQGIPFGSPLAPQSWVGQAGVFGGGQPFGQFNPLANQLGQRSFQVPGISPWGY